MKSKRVQVEKRILALWGPHVDFKICYDYGVRVWAAVVHSPIKYRYILSDGHKVINYYPTIRDWHRYLFKSNGGLGGVGVCPLCNRKHPRQSREKGKR